MATSSKLRELVLKNYYRNKTIREVAVELNIPKTTVWNIIKHYGETGNILDKKGKSPGRPTLISDRNKRLLVKLCKKGRRNTLRQITAEWNRETGLNLSRECCRQWIHRCGLKFYKAKEKPLMTEKQKKARLAWAKSKLSWSVEDWSRVIFSDESKFDICVGDHRKQVIRTKHETFHKDCLKRTIKFPIGVMIWGCMTASGLGYFAFIDGTVNAAKYQQILQNCLLPSIAKLNVGENYIFQQDSAACHTTKTTKKWFGDHNVSVLSWPSNSPDLNVIETVWHKMKQTLRNNPQRTLPELRAKLEQIWNGFTPEACRSLVESMPNRIRAVIKYKGDVTPF